MIALAFVVVLGLVVGVVVRGARGTLHDATAPRLRTEAVVVDKRTEVTGGGEFAARQAYYVTFQLPDGNRVELGVSGTESGMLVVGGQGSLEWQGSRYLGFVREILR